MPAGSENEPQSTVATPMVEKVGVTGFDFTMANLSRVTAKWRPLGSNRLGLTRPFIADIPLTHCIRHLAVSSQSILRCARSSRVLAGYDQSGRRSNMAIYMYQAAYTAESWAAQVKKPQNRVEAVGRQACEAVGGKLLGGWYCFGDYDLVIVADVPDNESMSAIALAIASGGAIKSSKTTVLMTGTEILGALKKAIAVAKTYKPAR
jgi:uncharacterized protein with GYD domain